MTVTFVLLLSFLGMHAYHCHNGYWLLLDIYFINIGYILVKIASLGIKHENTNVL